MVVDKTAGKRPGRALEIPLAQRQEIIKQLKSGASLSAVSRDYKISEATVLAIRDEDAAEAADQMQKFMGEMLANKQTPLKTTIKALIAEGRR